MTMRKPSPRFFALVSAAFAALFAYAAYAQTMSAVPVITSGPSVADAEITDTSAIVRWQTDVESTTVVDFGTTETLGQEYKKIVPMEETETTEISHSMTLWGLAPSTTYYYQVSSAVTGGAPVKSSVLTFTTHASAPACTADEWSCADWGTCTAQADGTYAQTRGCTLKTDCPGVVTPKPATTQTCTPACTADVWSCATWGACTEQKDGSYSQTRDCTLKTDCPGVVTPKPATAQSCKPTCTEDVFSCTDWGTCSAQADGTYSQTRDCTLKTDCPGVTTAKPAVTQSCKPSCTADEWSCGDWGTCDADSHKQTRGCTLKTDCPGVDTPKPAETQDCTPTNGTKPGENPDTNAGTDTNATVDTNAGTDTNAPGGGQVATADDGGATVGDRQTGAAPPSPAVVLAAMGEGDKAASLADECAKAGILPARCAAWLEAKYADKTCEAQGIFTKESCIAFLSGKNGGTFPGCAGLSQADCDAVIAKATLGYLPSGDKSALDDLLKTKKAAEVFDALGPEKAALLIAVKSEKKDKVKWWPSAYVNGKETSPGFIVFDVDKDGIPDDVEKRLGTDPATPDVTGMDGKPDAKVTRDVLNALFQTGEVPSQDRFVIADMNGDGMPDMVIDDRKLLGLKTYDPAKTYVVGDAVIYGGKQPKPLPKSFFETGAQTVSLDLNGDGKPDALVTKAVLKSFFMKGDKPTSAQFQNLIDSKKFSPTDLAFLLGDAIEQPVAAGDVDPTFNVKLAAHDGQAAGGPGTFDPTKWNVLQGHAAANATVILYVYSYVPMVLTTTTDADGNYTYDLADNVVDGSHTAYVAVTDDTGKITQKSEPLSLFVKGAVAATSEADFLKPDVNVQPTTSVIADYTKYYLIGVAGLVLVALGFAWSFSRKLNKPAPPKAS